MSKRDREEEDEVLEAVQELASTVDRDQPLLKLRALDRVAALLDPSDELYTTHRALVEEDAAYYLVQLAQDPSPAVALKAADAIRRLAAHSAAAVARLAAGPLQGLESSVERVMLNPVQGALIEEGALGALAPMVLSGQEAQAGPATEAVNALCSYFHEGKVAYLEQLVQANSPLALGPLEMLLGGMECGSEDVAHLLDRLQAPLLQWLLSPSQTVRLDCLALLGTLLEKRPDMVGAFRDAGVAPLLADIIIRGSPEEQDQAVHCLWLVAKGDKSLLGEEGGLTQDLVGLAGSLVLLVKAAAEEEKEAAREEQQQQEQATRASSDEGGSESDDGAGAGLRRGGLAGAAYQPPRLDICYAEEASKLLRELAARHEQVAELVERSEVAPVRSKASCCVM